MKLRTLTQTTHSKDPQNKDKNERGTNVVRVKNEDVKHDPHPLLFLLFLFLDLFFLLSLVTHRGEEAMLLQRGGHARLPCRRPHVLEVSLRPSVRKRWSLRPHAQPRRSRSMRSLGLVQLSLPNLDNSRRRMGTISSLSFSSIVSHME